MGARERLNVGEIRFKGIPTKVGTPNIIVLARNAVGRVLVCSGTVVPSADDKGYAAGCIFFKTNDGTVYFNGSATTSASFALQGVVGAGAITSAELATSAVAATRLGDAAVKKSKVKYIQATMAVASNTTSLSVSSASFTNGVIVGVNHAFTNFVGSRVLHAVSLIASTAKVLISGATTHTGGATYILTILRA